MSGIGKEVTVFDADTGELMNRTISYGSQNGDGWVIIYREAYMNFLLAVPDLTTAKVFGSLMTKQEFTGGIKTTKQAIADELNISYRSILKAFSWLKNNGYLKERKVMGIPEFLLNPDITTCGKNKGKKENLWNEN